MSDGVRVEVRVRGRLGGDLLAMVAALDPRVVPRHTVLTVAGDDVGGSLVGVVQAVDRAGFELEEVISQPG